MPRHTFFLLLAAVACVAAAHHTAAAAPTADVRCLHPSLSPALLPFLVDGNGTRGVPLEQYLWQEGAYPVTGVVAGGHYIDWADAAYRSLWYVPVLMLPSGGLSVFGERVDDARDIAVFTVPRPDRSVLDVAPTACEALGLAGRFDGVSRSRVNASQVVVIYADAVGWYRYQWARPAMRNLSRLSPEAACCVYPSISNVNAAAMLTGAVPERSGVDRWDNRTMLTDDAIGLALRNGVSAAWINGPKPPPVALGRGLVVAGDADGDGSPDDEVTSRALAEYQNGTRLLYVHLVGADRALHASGPYSRRSLDAVARIDALIGQLAGQLRPGTLLIVVADHGGHEIAGGLGDHGSLLPQDMLVPIAIRCY